MRTIQLGKTGLTVPAIAVGCMRLTGLSKKEAASFIQGAIEQGANYFDHADIYGAGACETLFGQAFPLKGANREKVLLQSKCGIVPGKMFDFSKEHILQSVDGILSRLGTEYLDALLLHRPDALMEPDEVAEAFAALKQSGKVRHFGVSNQNAAQMALLQASLPMPIAANQLQLSITNANLIAQGMHVNMLDEPSVNRDGSTLDHCRLHGVTIQPWSPFQYGFFEGVFLGSPKYPKLNAAINDIAKEYGVSDTCVAMAWLLRHPAKFQPVTGTMNAARLADCARATEITLTREQWYRIHMAAGYTLP